MRVYFGEFASNNGDKYYHNFTVSELNKVIAGLKLLNEGYEVIAEQVNKETINLRLIKRKKERNKIK